MATNAKWWIVGAILALVVNASAAAPMVLSERADVSQLIEEATVPYRATFQVSLAQAVEHMDGILKQYHSRGSIKAEPDANLKSLYFRAAHLILNGYPIAGGTLISLARTSSAFAGSPAGRAFAAFVDAMLAPSSEPDDILGDYKRRADKALAIVIAGLRPELHLTSALWVVGVIYDDAIAVDAGRTGVARTGVTEAEDAVLQRALLEASR